MSGTPHSTMINDLRELMQRQAQLEGDIKKLERNIFFAETTYFQRSTVEYGNVISGYNTWGESDEAAREDCKKDKLVDIKLRKFSDPVYLKKNVVDNVYLQLQQEQKKREKNKKNKKRKEEKKKKEQQSSPK